MYLELSIKFNVNRMIPIDYTNTKNVFYTSYSSQIWNLASSEIYSHAITLSVTLASTKWLKYNDDLMWLETT